MTPGLRQRVFARARGRCEYCLFPLEFDAPIWHVDHIIAEQHGGATRMSNLAAACAFCNKHKGTNIATVRSRSRALVRLYNPRKDNWSEHFRYLGPRVIGISDVGRATVAILAMNAFDRVAVRASLIDEGHF